MGAETALRRLTNLGFTVTLNGDKLHVEPASCLTDDLRHFIRSAKPELLAELQAHFRYAVTLPNGETFESRNWPPVSSDELATRYRGAKIQALPDQDPPKRKASLTEINELNDLARLIYQEETDQRDAVELALLNVDAGLVVLRQLAEPEIADRKKCGQICCRECNWFVAMNRVCGKQRAPTIKTIWRRCNDYKRS